MTAVRLLALDVDGTLVPSGSDRVHPADVTAIHAARSAGAETMLVTGRSWRGCRAIYGELGLTLPTITYLGAQVVAANGALLHELPVPETAVEVAWDLARRRRLCLVVCLGAEQAVANFQAEDFSPWAHWNPYTEVAGDLTPYLAGARIPMLVAYGTAAVKAFREAFPLGLPGCAWELYNFHSDECLLHIWRQGVDKSATLARVCRELGIRPGEVLAMGDGPTDLEMLRWAGTGVAVAHAPRPVRGVARLVTAPRDPHPVASALRRLGII